MAKVKEDDGQQPAMDARIKAPWVIEAEKCRHARRPVKLQVYVDADAKRRVELAALVEGLDFSLVLTGLIKTTLVGYYAGVRGGSKDEAA